MIRVREALLADAPLVATLLTNFNTEFDTPVPDLGVLTRRFEALLPLESVLVVLAETEEGPAGFAYLTLRPTPYWDGPLAQLEELYVVPELRGRGIGTAVMERVLAICREKGCEEMLINVDEPDEGARRFYERLGFSNYEIGEDYRMLCYIRQLGAEA
ncbi:GNAT family N-acetyltransferase [Corynebacterium sp. Q4381]